MAFTEQHKVFMNFQENGSAGRKPESGRPKKRTPEVIEEARQAMEEAPGTSIEHLSQQLGQSPDKILVMDFEQVAEFGEPERLFAQF
ncbi:hypothetical protein MTP99_004707 [Tenebrio molitor]|nr:hypothetical protein MTP99_004707 [Tenebrio molitor]